MRLCRHLPQWGVLLPLREGAMVTPSATATPHPARFSRHLLLKEKAADAVLSAVDFLILLLRKKAF